MFCSNCGKEIPDGSEFCPYCGTNLNEEIKKEKTEVVEEVKENICNNCKKEIPEESDFCPYCGYNLKDNIPSTDVENDSIAYENEIETTTKPPMKSKVVIIIMVIVGIVTIAFYNAWKIYKKANNSLNSFNNQLSEINDNKKEEQEEKKEESKIDKDEIKKKYKDLLNDKEWVKKNLYISKNYFGEKISSNKKQYIEYAIFDDDKFTVPVGVVVTIYDGEGDCNRCTILTYENGKVKTKIVDTDRVTFSVDKKKKLLFAGFAKMGAEKLTVYSVNDKEVKKKDVLEKIEEIDENAELYYTYFINDKEVSKSKYFKLYEEYVPEDYEGDELTKIKQ